MLVHIDHPEINKEPAVALFTTQCINCRNRITINSREMGYFGSSISLMLKSGFLDKAKSIDEYKKYTKVFSEVEFSASLFDESLLDREVFNKKVAKRKRAETACKTSNSPIFSKFTEYDLFNKSRKKLVWIIRDEKKHLISITDDKADIPKMYFSNFENYEYAQLLVDYNLSIEDIRSELDESFIVDKKKQTISCYITDTEIVYAHI